MAIQQQIIDADSFWELTQLPEYADKVLDLVGGEIIEMSKPGGLHGVIVMRLGRYLDVFVYENKLGYVTAAETGYILQRNPDGRDTVRGLDSGFIRSSKLPDGMPEGHVPIAPDLAVEVISPGNTAEDIQLKVRELLKAGTQLIWIVYPKTKTVEVHTQQRANTLELDDTLSGQDILPGFELKISDIFPV